METITSEQIKQAIERAKTDARYGEELKVRLETGKYDTQLSEIGVKRTPTGLQKISMTETSDFYQKDGVKDIMQISSDIGQTLNKGMDKVDATVKAYQSGEQGTLKTAFDLAGAGAGAVSNVLFDSLKGVVKSILPQSTEDDINQYIGKVAPSAINTISKYEELQKTNPLKAKIVNLALAGIPNATLGIGELMSGYEKLKVTNPALARSIDSTLGFASLFGDLAGIGEAGKLAQAGIKTGMEATSGIAKGVGEATAKAGSSISEGVTSVGKGISNTGVGQIASEFASRVPRAANRVSESISEASARATRMKSATPEIKNAIINNVDERIINTIDQADDATKQAYKEVIDIAEESPKTIGTKKQSTAVGGELASKQYDLINKQKESIGKQIGDTAKELSKTEKIAMRDSFDQMDDVLANQGITLTYTKKGVKLDFSGSKYTPAQRKKIQELYDLATEGGDTLSPSQIRGKDQLFSQLKRESQYEGIGDLIIETSEGNKSLFNVFRGIYSSKLDAVSPQLKVLNNQYRKLSQITDDIEDSIFKTPNYNVTKSVDPAEFAKVNLRRIFGEAQSSPVYEAVADAMDKLSRQLGYEGATPKVVAEFAQEMRKIFPDTIPKTGFTGGIRAGIGDIIEQVSKVGAPNLKDQQKAIRELIGSYLTSKKK